MGTAGRPENPPVNPGPAEGWDQIRRLLQTEPWSFQFFQAIRLLEKLWPDQEPIGRFSSPASEVVRLRANSETSFPASQVFSLEWPEGGGQPVMSVNFMGLTGPSGVLPLYYSMMVRERLRAKDPTLRDFLAMFDHRMLSLFYQAWEKYHFAVAYEKGQGDHLTRRLFDLIGMGTPGLQGRQAVPDDGLLFYAGLLGPHPRSATALAQLLMDYFEVPVSIEQFVGAWRSVDADVQCCLGRAGESQQLGVGVVVGDEVWDQQAGIRISLGPLSISQYLAFLPNGRSHGPLKALVEFYTGGEFEVDVQLVLRREDVPQCELGADGSFAPRLGWLTWSGTALRSRDGDETILRI